MYFSNSLQASKNQASPPGCAAPHRHKIVLTTVLTMIAIVFSMSMYTASSQAYTLKKDPCANKLCTKMKPGVKSCYRHGNRSKNYQRASICFISRAARHYKVSDAQLIRVSRCESTLRWWISGAHQGLFQYNLGTWASVSAYGRKGYNVYSPKWASLGAAEMFSRGFSYHWQCK